MSHRRVGTPPTRPIVVPRPQDRCCSDALASSETPLLGWHGMEEELIGVQAACPECGKRREDWTNERGRGYALEGVDYRSERCALKARARGA